MNTVRFLAQVGLALLCCLPVSKLLAQDHDFYDFYGRDGKTPREGLRGSVETHHLYKGIKDLYTGHLEYAKGEFEFILAYFPNHPRALILMVDTMFRMRQPYVVEEHIRRALNLYPGNASTQMIYGVYLQRAGKLTEAVQAHLRAIQLDPDYVDAYYNLGLVYLDLKKNDKANWYAQKAYAMGVKVPGLRTRLEKVKAWNTEVDLNVLPDVLPTLEKPQEDEKPVVQDNLQGEQTPSVAAESVDQSRSVVPTEANIPPAAPSTTNNAPEVTR